MTFFLCPSFSNAVKFEVSSYEPDEDGINSEETSDNQSEEQDGVHEDEEGERKSRKSQNQVDEDSSDKEEEETNAVEVQERVEGDASEINNEDMQEEKERRLNGDAVLGAFLQVSEPALVSSHHDGFLRFWNLSVSSVPSWKLHTTKLR